MADKTITELPVASAISPTDVSILVSNNVDYQFDFALLLQFISANINTGAAISFGTAIPQNNSGKNGDVFFKTDTLAFYQKTNGTWVQTYSPAASTNSGTTLLYAEGVPGGTIGADGDSYINTTTGIFYLRTSGTWSQVFSMATGPQGPQGTAGTNGTNGTNGNTLLSGTTDPLNANGNNGDYYINLSTYALFGPKTSDTWGTGVSLIGETGPAGAAGANGTNGANGVGVPAGGAANQVLKKIDGTDYNTEWANETGGGAALPDGVIDGLSLSISGVTVTIGPGQWRVNGTVYQTTSNTILPPLQAPDPTYNRIDVIYIVVNSFLVQQGTPSPNPIKPAIPTDNIEIGFAIINPAGTNSVGNAPTANYVTTAQLLNITGDKTTLVTNNKNTLVEAINEMAENILSINQDNVILKIFKKSNYS